MKKLLSVMAILSLMVFMLTGMAAPKGGEATPRDIRDRLVGEEVVIIPNSNTNQRLNMYVSNIDNIKNGTNVTTWNTPTNDGTQSWIINYYKKVNNVQRYTISPYTRTDYVINYYTDGTQNCTMYSEVGNDEKDFAVSIVSEGTLLDEYYGIVLPERLVRLTVMQNDPVTEGGVEKGYNVMWKAPIASVGVDATQAWDVNKWFA